MRRFLTLFLVCVLARAGLCGAGADWENLFDGKSLDGWVQRNGKALYSVEDGAIVGTTVLNTPNSFLCTEKMYSDFVLELEFLVEGGMNSGIQIRSNSFEHYKNYRVHGYQVEIDPSSRAWSGGIYDEARRGWLYDLKDKPAAQKAFKQGQWNHYRIEAKGDRIRTWVNGIGAADLRDDMTSTGFISLQVHGSKTAGQKIRWRNIRIQDLSRDFEKAPLKALIVDGQNNHDWKGTTPVLKRLLEETRIFTVEVATTPAGRQPMDSFRPDFKKYDVIVANYTGDEWPGQTKDDLVEYMNNGGGLVIFHAADNAFPGWKEWNEMIAVGGWGGRNEKSGPMVRWRDGKVFFDESPGAGGTHGPQHEFQVVTRDRHHAITAGLPEKWMHSKDELYSKLRGPAKNMTVLATAYADPSKGGTGEHEPALFTVRYGKGRVFHTVLGHGPEQLRSVGFIFTFRRGTEWAATGGVTQVEVPGDFPTANEVSLRAELSADYGAIEAYDFGKSRAALAAIEEEIRNASRPAFAEIEGRLLAALASEKTTFAGRQFVCRMLRRVGSAQSVPALSKMLGDRELSHMARFALQHMGADEAGRALRAALVELDGDLRIGVVGSLGRRGDRKAVSGIARLLRSSDEKTALAAITALGRIGGSQAAGALAEARVATKLTSVRNDALLMCADSILAEGNVEEAGAIYRKMTGETNTTWIRIAAYRGLVQAEQEKAIPHIAALLKSEDLDLQRAAGSLIAETPGAGIARALAEQLGSLGSDAQVVLLGALEARGDKSAGAQVASAVKSRDASVSLAAVKALGILGGAREVGLLAETSAAKGEIGKAALNSLNRLSGDGVTEAMVRQLRTSSSDSAVCVNVIGSLAERGETEAMPALLMAAKGSDSAVRQAAYKALGALGGERELGILVSMLSTARDSSDRGSLERALIAVVVRLEKRDASAVVAGLSRADASVKPHLLAVLSQIGGDSALAAVRREVGSSDPAVRRAAIRSLADWPDATALEDLMRIAKARGDSADNVLALRGYIKLLGMPANRSAADTVGLLDSAMAAAGRVEEKKAVLAALQRYPCEEALALAERSKGIAGLSTEAELASSKIKEALQKKNLKAQASLNSGKAAAAMDDNAGTRWDTGRPMKPGDWFVLDLGVESSVGGVVLDARNSPNDYPRGYEVYVSFDGGNWGKAVVTGKGTKPLTEIAFGKAVRARFIRIVQTGSSESWFWSIHELAVKYE